MNEPRTFAEAVRIVTWHINHQCALRDNGIEMAEKDIAGLIRAGIKNDFEEVIYEGMWKAGAYPADIERAFALCKAEIGNTANPDMTL